MMTALGPVVYDIAGVILKKRTVQVVLYPQAAKACLSLDAGRHLYRLLQRYNWCFSDQDRYLDRWGSFWPSISAVERKVISLFIMANYAGQFGSQIELKDIPIEFRDLQGEIERTVLTGTVEKEFRKVVCGFYKRFIGEKDVDEWLKNHAANEYQSLTLFGAAKLAFVDGCFEPENFRARCRDALLSLGSGAQESEHAAYLLDTALQDFLILREMNVWPPEEEQS